MVSSALGKALGLTEESTLEELKDGIIGVKDYSSSIQYGSTDTSNQFASCYRVANGYVDVVPARGFWNNWNWDVSCIKLPVATVGSNLSAATLVDSFSGSFQNSTAAKTSTIYEIGLYFVIAHAEANTTSTSGASIGCSGGAAQIVGYSRGYQASATAAALVRVVSVPGYITMAGSNYRAGTATGYIYKIS